MSMMPLGWGEEVDEILAGDLVVALAYATPAHGVVILPMVNLGLRDREKGTLTVNTSLGAYRKLARIRANPRVTLVFHTRTHSLSARGEYILAQGRAALSEPIDDYPSLVREQWARFERWPPRNPIWRRWQRPYALRVEIVIRLERLMIWPDLGCGGELEVIGTPRAAAPAPQSLPAKGTAPRLDAVRAARRLERLPHRLLGWIDADGYPVAAPVSLLGASEVAVELLAPAGLLPAGGRRAGLTAHWFSDNAIGQDQRKYTGWLEVADATARLLYAPHTEASYRLPTSRTLYRLGTGAVTRYGLSGARAAGLG